MIKERTKVLIDFDGTLTDETAQAAELSGVAVEMLAGILGVSVAEVEARYLAMKAAILSEPAKYPWIVNGLPACYAYEGAYLLNTAILQEVIRSDPRFLAIVENKYPDGDLDSVTSCLNYLFHKGSFAVNPHFLPDASDFLRALVAEGLVEPVIFTNSEARKIAHNLSRLSIGERGSAHGFPDEIGILGDTRQYFLDSNWKQTFSHPIHGEIQALPMGGGFSVELRRPIYYAALRREINAGYDQLVVVADGFSLAGALPLVMGYSFVLAKTDYTPDWAETFVGSEPRGRVAKGLSQMKAAIDDLVANEAS